MKKIYRLRELTTRREKPKNQISKKEELMKLANAVAVSFPMNKLRKIDPDKVGNPNQDYGGIEQILAFEPTNEKVGRYIIGAYESDQKQETFGDTTTEDGWVTQKTRSKIGSLYFNAIKTSLEYALINDNRLGKHKMWLDTPVLQRTLRMEAIRGARTKAHTDGGRGTHPSFVMFHDDGGGLRYRIWPHFKASVVRLGNMLCIPMNIDPSGLQLYVQDENDTNECVRILVPPECLHNLQPYGVLEEYMIVGIKNHQLQIMPFGETCTTASPNLLHTKSIVDVFKHALQNGDNSYPKEGKSWYRVMHKAHVWHSFFAWRHIHEWSPGKNILCPRTHVFFRALRQHPVGCNYNSNGKTNFVTLTKEQAI